MPFKFFTIPIHDAGQAEAELNSFLRSHKVLSVDRRWVEQGSSSFWSFCVDYLETSSGATSDGRQSVQRGKVDYKEVLSPEEFAVFARLREVRKAIAAAEAVPVYTIFTNEQLARMVQAKVVDRAGLEKIAGVGDARIDKYGARMLEVLAGAWANSAPLSPGTPGERGRG
jgi:superfamily II DNA helicase RecQ